MSFQADRITFGPLGALDNEAGDRERLGELYDVTHTAASDA
jgi:hypothetical protein